MKSRLQKYHVANPLWRVPVTWRTTYDWNRSKISTSMEDALRFAVGVGGVQQASRNTRQALKERGLCDGDRLTPEGRVVAVTLFSLPQQCEFLGIPFKVLRLPKNHKPELAVMEEIAKSGRKVAYCEGGAIMLLLYCLCFQRLYRLAIRYWGSESAARSYMYTSMMCHAYLLERWPHLPENMLTDIAHAHERVVLQSFDVLKSWQNRDDSWAFRDWIGVDRNLIQQLFRALGNSRCVALARRYLTDPYAYSKGWPDLVWIGDEKTVGLTEVKTTDRLHWSQVITIPEMSAVGHLLIEVVRVNWADAPNLASHGG